MRAALAFSVIVALAYADALRTHHLVQPVVARVMRAKRGAMPRPSAADLDLEALGRAYHEDACEAFCMGASHQ